MMNKQYPFIKVILGYALLGGLVGSFLIALPFIIFGGAIIAFAIMSFGIIIGFVPALLTGMALSYFKIKIIKNADYLLPVFLGFMICFLYFVMMGFVDEVVSFYPFSKWGLLDILSFSAMMGMVGGISSVILAKFILPKY